MASKFEWDEYPDEPQEEGAGETALGAVMDVGARGYNAVGGAKGIGYGAGGLASIWGARKILPRLANLFPAAPASTAPPPPGGPPATPTAPADPQPATSASEDRISEAKAAKAEADARAAAARADAAEARARPPESATKRTTRAKEPKPKPRTKRPPAKVPVRTSKPRPSLEERVPITVDDKPASRGKSQRGVSKRVLANRAPKAAPAAADDLMAQLGQSVKAAGAMRGAGDLPTGVKPEMFRRMKAGGIRVPKAGGALAALALIPMLSQLAGLAGEKPNPGYNPNAPVTDLESDPQDLLEMLNYLQYGP